MAKNKLQELYETGCSDPMISGIETHGSGFCVVCENDITSENYYVCNGSSFHLACAREYSTYYIVQMQFLEQKLKIDKLESEQQIHKNRLDTSEWTTIPRLENAIKEVKELFEKGGKLLQTMLGREG